MYELSYNNPLLSCAPAKRPSVNCGTPKKYFCHKWNQGILSSYWDLSDYIMAMDMAIKVNPNKGITHYIYFYIFEPLKHPWYVLGSLLLVWLNNVVSWHMMFMKVNKHVSIVMDTKDKQWKIYLYHRTERCTIFNILSHFLYIKTHSLQCSITISLQTCTQSSVLYHTFST